MGKYIDRIVPKRKKFTCAHIFVKVDLEKGLPIKIMFSHGSWEHVHPLDYDQLPFKYKIFHEYTNTIPTRKWKTQRKKVTSKGLDQVTKPSSASNSQGNQGENRYESLSNLLE